MSAEPTSKTASSTARCIRCCGWRSLALLYSARTHRSGLRVDPAECKSIGFARYRRSRHMDDFMQHLIDLDSNSDSRPERGFLDTRNGVMKTAKHFYPLFIGPPCKPERPLAPPALDLAASAQARPRKG